MTATKTKLVGACAALAVAAAAGGCGGGGKTTTVIQKPSSTPTTTTPPTTTTTPTTPPTTPTTPTTTSPQSLTPTVEASNVASCLKSQGLQVKERLVATHPLVLGKSGRGGVGFVLFGPAGGAKAFAARFSKQFPNDSVFESPNDQVMIVYAHKPNTKEFNIGNTCQKAAYNG